MRYILIVMMLAGMVGCSPKQSPYLFADNGYIYSENTAYLLVPEDDLRKLFNDEDIANLYIANRRQLNRVIQMQIVLDNK